MKHDAVPERLPYMLENFNFIACALFLFFHTYPLLCPVKSVESSHVSCFCLVNVCIVSHYLLYFDTHLLCLIPDSLTPYPCVFLPLSPAPNKSSNSYDQIGRLFRPIIRSTGAFLINGSVSLHTVTTPRIVFSYDPQELFKSTGASVVQG